MVEDNWAVRDEPELVLEDTKYAGRARVIPGKPVRMASLMRYTESTVTGSAMTS